MRLTDLEPYFVRREIRPCAGYGVATDCNTVSQHTEHEWLVPVSFADADGIYFLCPKCFAEHPDRVGVHGIICWRPRVPPDIKPNPGRWEFTGTGLDDLSLVAGSSSVLLTGGCCAHFHVTNGQIIM